MAQARTISGAQIICYINGQIVGSVVGANFAVKKSNKPAVGLDQATPFELMPSTYTVNGTINVLREHGTGGLEGIGITTFSNTLLLEKYISIELLDRLTDKVIFKAINALVEEQNWSISPKQVMSGSFSFTALDYTNEADV